MHQRCAIAHGERLLRVEQHALPIESFADHGKQDAVPGAHESALAHHPIAKRGIADVYAVAYSLLEHDEVMKTVDLDHRNGRHLQLLQRLCLHAVAAPAQTDGFHVTLHVEHREALVVHE